ncbi:hypothetical protein C1I99_26335 [Micromonospora deserti]|uniref:Uncharacterized protein n=1 Tax=Micromonospora deserti TaxID=2070366 RepID=A0A2W2BN68_9ACTN|nr:hypothetical protein C1I99_26335 [Micromonospora deserti]
MGRRRPAGTFRTDRRGDPNRAGRVGLRRQRPERPPWQVRLRALAAYRLLPEPDGRPLRAGHPGCR